MIDAQIDKTISKASRIFKLIDAKLDLLLESELNDVHVQKKGRLKTKASIKKKISVESNGKTQKLTDLTDVVAFRFVCHFQADVPSVIRALLNEEGHPNSLGDLQQANIYFSSTPGQASLKDEIAILLKSLKPTLTQNFSTKDSRYTSVHLIFKAPEESHLFEIQIRNVFEDAWAEIEHALKYKHDSAHGAKLSPTVSRHLKVLNSYTHACAEYAEQIVLDALSESKIEDWQEAVKPLVGDDVELSQLPPPLRTLITRIKKYRDAPQFELAINELSDYYESKKSSVENNRLSKYYLLMERGLCFLKLGDVQSAMSDYQLLLEENPDKALIYYRLGDAFRIAKNFNEAAIKLEIAEQKRNLPANTLKEKEFLQRLPITLANTYWRMDKPKEALNTLKNADFSQQQQSSTEFSLKLLNSQIYYELEIAKQSEKEISKATLKRYKEKLLAFKVDQGNYFGELDTLMIVYFKLKDCASAIACANLLENMIGYEDFDAKPIVRLKNGTINHRVFEEIEMVRSHISYVKNSCQS